MNNSIHFPKEITFSKVEEFLKDINTKEINELSIVKNLGNYKFSMLPIILQMISTLYIKNKHIKVVINEIGDDDLIRFSKNLVYLSTVMRSNLLVDRQEKEYQKQYITYAKEYLDSMKDINRISQTYKGIGVSFICFDWSNQYSYIDTLYNFDKLITKEEFKKFIAPEIFSNSMSKANSWQSLKEDIKNDFASILYELFENTELHARDNSPLIKSMRGFLVKELLLNKNEILDKYDEIKEYLVQIETFKNENSKYISESLNLLEMTIFDNGKGLAKSISKTDNFSFEEELKLVTKCFNKHVTSTKNESRGVGLYEVMEMIVKYKGLFILRTGRTHLIIDYKQIEISGSQINFKNIIKKEYQPIIGTSYTIILPLLIQKDSLNA